MLCFSHFQVLIQSWERSELPPEDAEEGEEEDMDMISLRQSCIYGVTQVYKG